MRSVNSAISTATVKNKVAGIYYIKLCFDTGNVCWHTGFGLYTFNSDTYSGFGNITTVSAVTEAAGVKASGMSIGAAGIKSEVVSLLIGQPYINRKAFVYFMPLDDNDQPVCASPQLLFRGTIDNIQGTLGANAGFTIALKSRFSDWERPINIIYSDVEQQQLYPGDTGMQFIAQLSQKKIIWPLAKFLPDPRD